MTRLPWNAPIRRDLSCTIYRPLQSGVLFVNETQWLHILTQCLQGFIIFIKLRLVFKQNVVANSKLLEKYAVLFKTPVLVLCSILCMWLAIKRQTRTRQPIARYQFLLRSLKRRFSLWFANLFLKDFPFSPTRVCAGV